jgi:DNA-binding response OmpR family regulator
MKALIIEDEPALRRLLADFLREAGYEVCEAADGRIGLQQFTQFEPDLVVSDIIMPNEEGIATIRKIRAQNPDVKIVAISGGGRVGNVDFLRIAREYGATTTLAKPFRKQEFIDLIRRL